METQQQLRPRKRVVLGVGISASSYEEVVRVCGHWVEQRRRWKCGTSADAPAGRYICVTSVHGIVSAVLDSQLKSTLNRADIATPDGMPVVWALRSFGEKEQQRVYGPDLMLTLCADAEARGHRLYFYGGHNDILQNLRSRLSAKFPGLIIAGEHSPPFRPLTPVEDERCVQDILASDADIVFVGLSTPKQDRWMVEHRDRLPGVILIGVGAAFDFHAGRVRQAPPRLQRCGLEWFFRLLMEPKRLWKRYVFITPIFLPLWALQKIGLLKYSAVPDEVGQR
jgi:N-acetylglucosaminyldiphosphoundecaprenol N-acetyl-beta-D-mannosaminyltransferase